jgi:hypothetical protein
MYSVRCRVPMASQLSERSRDAKPHSILVSVDRADNWTLLFLYVSTRDAIMASIHRNHGTVAALLADIKHQPDDVTQHSKTSFHETSYAPAHSASGKNR